MQYLKVTNLTKSFSIKPIVDGVDFTIDKGQKIALVARNGAGKSTLLNLIAGEIDLSDGEVEFNKNIKIGFLSQNIDFDLEQTVIDCLFSTNHPSAQIIKKYEQMIISTDADPDELNEVIVQMEENKAWEYESKVNIILSKLNIIDLLQQKIATLSGGEAKRVALARMLVDEPDFLLLDEPTNHLDLEMIEWLENYFDQQNTTLLMITHDRYFLERVCTDIFELDRGKIFRYPGNYSYFLEKKAIREENEKIEIHKLKQLFTKELARIRKSPRARSTKQQFRQDRYFEIEKNYESKRDIHFQEGIKLELSMQERQLGSKILKIKGLSKMFGDKKIIEQFNHEFRHNERIGIIGKNGVGKSTFLDMIMGLQEPDTGIIQPGEKVVFGYYKQKEIIVPHDKTMIDFVRDASEFLTIADGHKISAGMMLERFLFPKSQHHLLVDMLSGGEKKRLYLLTVLMRNPNFLILDEPTNDLDLVTLGVLEDFLLQYQGCLVVVSHDRYFMDKIVDRIFAFEGNGVVKDFRGTYSEYKDEEDYLKKNSKKTIARKVETEEHHEPKFSHAEKQELAQLLKDIKKLEDRKSDIHNSFDDKNMPYDDITKLSQELAEIIKKIELKENRRFELMSRA